MVHPSGAITERATPAGNAAPGADDDRGLLARMAAGDERALGALYDRWSAITHALALRIVGDRDEAEDVVEETFWQLWRQASRYAESRGSVSTWLLTIARSRALDRRRALQRRREDRLEADAGDEASVRAAPEVAAAAPDPSILAEADERRTIVVGALRELPEEQRETIELAYFSGLSHTEIAERTGQPLGTVKTRMRLAMQKLRESLSRLRESTA